MKISLFFLLSLVLMVPCFSKELSIEEFKKLIKEKEDKVPLIDELKVIPFSKKMKVTFKSVYPDRKPLVFSLNLEGRTVQGKYFVLRTKFDNDPNYTYFVRTYDKAKKLHINHFFFPNGTYTKAYGKFSKDDKKKIIWSSKSDKVKTKGIEEIKDGKSVTVDKHYDLEGNLLYKTISTAVKIED